MTGTSFLLLALAAVVAFGNWVAVERDARSLEYVCKPLTMVLLIGVAATLDVHDVGVQRWFLVALVLCLLGDVFLMLPQDRFTFGLAAFLLGHLAYVGGMVVDGIDLVRLGLGIVLVTLALVVVAPRIVRAVAAEEPAFGRPVIAYMVVISAMVASAVGTGRIAAIAGAASFYGSDTLIAWNRFLRELPHGRLAVMVTYHLGQLGLVLSLV